MLAQASTMCSPLSTGWRASPTAWPLRSAMKKRLSALAS
jgi:hypothetical protein